MKIYPIEAGNFKLDGGAMFGVVPKSIWQKTNPSDNNNMIDIATRSLLIEDGNKLILVDTGTGNKQSEKFFSYYYQWGPHHLDGSLKKAGFHRDDITDVLLTHLHFDHCGGAIQWNKDRTGYEPAFKNAIFWTNESHWQWAMNPNVREKASFLKENLIPMQQHERLGFIDMKNKVGQFLKSSELGFGVYLMDGHTEKQMLPKITYQNKTIVYTADLIPTVGHIPLAYVMGYDTRPLLTMNEKNHFLNEAADKGYLLFFEHDAHNEMCSLKKTERGIQVDEIFQFDEIFS